MKKRGTLVVFILLISVLTVFASGTNESEGKTHLTFWTALTTTADQQAHQKIIEAFQAENPDIEVTVEYVSHKDWYTRMMTSVTSGDYPDMVLCDQSEVAWMYYQGMLAPMNDVLSAIDPTGTDFVSGKASIDSCRTRDGNVWGIPFSMNINAIWYRADILNDLGIDPDSIRTWDDLYEVCELVKDQGYTAMGMALAREAAYQQLCIWSNANGCNFFDEENGAYLLDIPSERKKVEDALLYLKKLNDNGMMPAGVSNWMWVDYRTAMANGEVVFTSSWGGDIGVASEVNPDMLKNLSVMVHPVGPDGEEYPPYHDAGIWAWTITARAYETKKDAIDKWIEFFFEPENISIACAARPVYNLPLQKSVLESDVFYSDPITEMFKDEIEYLFEYALPTARRVGFEAGPSIVAGQISSQLFLSDAVQNYLFNNWSLEETMEYIDSNMKDVMEEFNYPIDGYNE